MGERLVIKAWTYGAYFLAASSIVATRVFRLYTLSETLAIAAFLCGLALWRIHRSADRLIFVGALLGLGGLILKGVFVLLGIGAESHDMTTHETVPGNPLLLHIHHLFFNVGFVFYFISIVSTVFKKIRTGNQP